MTDGSFLNTLAHSQGQYFRASSNNVSIGDIGHCNMLSRKSRLESAEHSVLFLNLQSLDVTEEVIYIHIIYILNVIVFPSFHTYFIAVQLFLNYFRILRM
jgi:hypothetical protein